MGKSFNDDVFNNSFNLDTINGLNISQEAINENKKETEKPKININLDEVKKEFKEQKENKVRKKRSCGWKIKATGSFCVFCC